MKILVWRSHGDTEVYCAESNEQILNIASIVLSITNMDWWEQRKKNHRKELVELCEYAHSRDMDDVSDWHVRQIVGNMVTVAHTEREYGEDAFQEFNFTKVTY